MVNSAFTELLGLLSVAVVTVWMFKKLHLPPILAYLFAGIITGTSGLELITNQEDIHVIAELGIVFLLFSLGLEFSVPRLLAMRHLVFGVGTAQVLVSLTVITCIVMLLGEKWESAFAVGGILALSSTAIVIKQLNESGDLHTKRGQIAISILLFQDIAVVPLLIVIPMLAGNGGESMFISLMWALGKGIAVVLILLSVGKWLLPKIFNEVAQVRTDELFVLTTILVAVIAGGLTNFFGLSMALGAFLAGMMLGESQYRHQLEADIRPFRDILMGLFFATVGMQLDIGTLITSIHWVVLGVITLFIVKTAITLVLAKGAGESTTDSASSAIMTFQMGEFGFVIIALALQNNLLSNELSSYLIGVGILSMAITPYLMSKSLPLAKMITSVDGYNEQTDNKPEFESKLQEHVVICGFGRVGQTVSRFLKLEAIPYIVLDIDPVRVKEAQAAGENVQFGHARDKDIVKAANVAQAKLVIVTFGDFNKAASVISNVKELAPDAKILVRTPNDDNLQEFQKSGVTEVVPESLEGSLMLVSHVLYMSGVPVSRILRRVRKERKNRYGFLHGFFPGETTDLRSTSKRDRLEFLHAVSLSSNASSIGKRIEELQLEERRVVIQGLRRDGEEISEPDPSTLLKAHDILVIKGKPRRVERAERFLLEGD